MLLCQLYRLHAEASSPPKPVYPKLKKCSMSIWDQFGEAGWEQEKESYWGLEPLHGGSDFASCLKNLGNLAKYWSHTCRYLWRQRSKSQRSAAVVFFFFKPLSRVNWREEGPWRRRFPCCCILKISSISTWSGTAFPEWEETSGRIYW